MCLFCNDIFIDLYRTHVKLLVSYSFICYLQGLDSFFDYKDTTFKGICQEIHLIKYLLQAFIKSIVLLLLTFYATKQ